MDTVEYRQSSLRDFLHIIFKRKNQILIFFAVTVFTVITITFVIRPVYEAKAKILVKIDRENLYMPPHTTNSQAINYNRDDQVNFEIELLKSRSLAEKVIKSLGHENIYKNMKYENVVLKFRKYLSVEEISKSDVIEVSYKHEDPETAALVVNTLTNVYLDEHHLAYRNSRFYNFSEESRISDAKAHKKMADVRVMQSAFKPIKPTSPKVLLNIVLAVLLGGFGGLGLAFFADYMDDSLGKPEHVEKVLQLPVLASIPKLEISDIRATSDSAHTKKSFTQRKTHSLRPQLAMTMMAIIVGGLLFIGFFYAGGTGSLALRSADSNREIRGSHSKPVPSNDKRPDTGVAFPDMSKKPVTVFRKDSPAVNSASSNHEIKGLHAKPVLSNDKKNDKKQDADVVFPDMLKQPMTISRKDFSNLPRENVELNVKAKNHKRPDKTVAGMEDEPMTRVTYKRWHTLYRIIIQTYGTYNDEILNEVLHANPDIISPTRIHEGQTINLPAIAKHGRISRAKDHQNLEKTVSVKKDVRMNRVVFEGGQSLYRIIIHTYGTYNDKILRRVLHANPDIISPTRIHEGQIINLPADNE